MQKIKNIEILRFIFIIQIVLMHLMCSKGLFVALPFDVPLYSHLNTTTKNAYLGVDYFFIISGFFLVLTFKETSIFSFIIKKIKRFLPTMLIGMGIILVLSFFYNDIPFNWYRFFYTVSFTSQLGFMPHNGIGYNWFICSLFWGLLFYFYCMKNFDKKYLNLIFSIIIIFSYALLVNNANGNFGNVRSNIFEFLNVGTLRAIAGIGIGYLIGNVYKENLDEIKKMHSNFIQKIIYTFIEVGLLFFIIYYSSFHNMKANPMLFILSFIILFITFLIKQGFVSKLLDNNFSSFIGKYVFTIYILDEPFEKYLWHLIPTLTPIQIRGGGASFL